jgi:restriction endonuclease S subunit
MMTGNTHPRLANEDVVNLVVPIPDIEVQQDIAGEVVRRREKARSLRDDAQFLWENAKRKFEEELFGAGSNVERVQKTANTKGGRK